MMNVPVPAYRCLLPLAALWIATSIATATPAHGQASSAPMAAQSPIPYAAAVAQATVPDGRLMVAVAPNTAFPLTVSRDSLSLPAPAEQVADAYKMATYAFGNVVAVGPKTMTPLGAPSGEPDVNKDLPAGDALKLLAASFSPDQWKAFTSARGIGLADLTTDAQKNLFALSIPSRALTIMRSERIPKDFSPPPSYPGDLPQARLRLGLEVRVSRKPSGQKSFMGSGPTERYYIDSADPRHAALYGAQVSSELPNTPKPSQLDFSAHALRQVVPVDGSIHTVDDLVGRVARTAGIELYADPHYGGRAVTISGHAAATAADLLRAVAFGVAGTYRKVGPAYVLTDDLQGVGARRELWSEFEDRADAILKRLLEAADKRLEPSFSADALPYLDPSVAPTPDQLARRKSSYPLDRIEVPYAQLTPGQREQAQRLEQTPGYRFDPPTPTEPASILPLITLELLLPSVDGPINMGMVPSFFTDYAMQRANDAMTTQRQPAARPSQPAQPAANAAPNLDASLDSIPNRALLIHPKTAADVDAAFTALKGSKIDKLWIDVFSVGQPRVPGLIQTADSLPDAAGDLLARALQDAKGTGVAVYPSVDLLLWGGRSLPDADLNILGQNSIQAAESTGRNADWSGETAQRGTYAADPLSVSPFSPDVRSRLIALTRRLAATPGVAGLVWQSAIPPGYANADERFNHADGRNDMGYSLDARLAFLRYYHADPIDVDVRRNFSGRAAVFIPTYDNPMMGAYQFDPKPVFTWNRFRADAVADLAAKLYAASAAGASVHAPVYVRQAHDQYDVWYAEWPGPGKPLPDYDVPYAHGTQTAAHALWPTVLTHIAIDTDGLLLDAVKDFPDRMKRTSGDDPAYDGFVLEWPARSPLAGPNTTVLARYLTGKPPATPKSPAL